MCGIAGIIANGGKINPAELMKMNDQIIHRGPDGNGIWHSENLSIGFAHRRLAIIDLSVNANQPMNYDDYVITFNGEIYNHLELRKSLQTEGYYFSTNSDTEVILVMFKKFGIECVKYLEGMFAFGLYDKVSRKTYLVRDRFGEKPIYYAFKGQSLFFASEIKCLFSIGISKRPRIEKFRNYIINHNINDVQHVGLTYYEDVLECKAAHYIIIDSDFKLVEKNYWHLEKCCKNIISEANAIEDFKHLLFNSVKQRLIADVQIGSSLSGGIDSSTIVSIINDIAYNNQLSKQKTFSARFDNFSKDEGKFINKLIDSKDGIIGHDVYPSLDGFKDDFRKLIYHQEEPFVSASVYNQFAVMRLASHNNVKVLLDGQGADEILGGYIDYYFHYLIRMAIFSPFKFVFEKRLYNQVHSEHRKFRLPRRLPFWLLKKKVTGKGIIYDRDIRDIMHEETCYTKLPSMLRYADKNSMAHSVEVRLPFLDHKIVEFLYSIPIEYLFNSGWTKSLLRKSFQNYLPNEICWRVDKIGYDAPQERWLKGFQEEIVSINSNEILQSLGLNPKSINLSDWKKLMLSNYYS
jgi:asparagine synthase (glutamine-hydrolysing)